MRCRAAVRSRASGARDRARHRDRIAGGLVAGRGRTGRRTGVGGTGDLDVGGTAGVAGGRPGRQSRRRIRRQRLGRRRRQRRRRVPLSPSYDHELGTLTAGDPKLKTQYERDSTTPTSELSPEAFKTLVGIRNQIQVQPGMQLSKVIKPSEAEGRLTGNLPYEVDSVRGSIARQSDVAHLVTPQQLRDGLSLDDSHSIAAAKVARDQALAEGRTPDAWNGSWTPIPEGAPEAFQMRWTAPSRISESARIPYGGPTGEKLRSCTQGSSRRTIIRKVTSRPESSTFQRHWNDFRRGSRMDPVSY